MLYDWYYIKSLYSENECEIILQRCENLKKYYKDYVDVPGVGKRVNTFVLESKPIVELLEGFYKNVFEMNKKYFGFDLYDEYPGIIHLNEYSGSNNEYPFHRDSFPLGTMCDIKLTAILNLSLDKFEGGDFEFFYGENVKVNEIRTAGSFIVFPSNTYHRVTPVTDGKRITLSAWFLGPTWK